MEPLGLAWTSLWQIFVGFFIQVQVHLFTLIQLQYNNNKASIGR